MLTLPKDLDARLEELARMTGQTKAALVEQAILAHVEDMEDATLASESCAALERGERACGHSRLLRKRSPTAAAMGRYSSSL